MAETHTTTSTVPRFGHRTLLIASGVAVALWAGWVAGLVFGVFPLADAARVTGSVVSGGATTTSTSTVELPAAEFAIAALFALGPLFILAGTVLGLAEMTMPRTATTSGGPQGGVVDGGPELAGAVIAGIPAVIGAAGDLAKSLSSGLKGLKTSVSLILVGTMLLIVGAALAWQTIPGTDLSPSVTSPGPVSPGPASPAPGSPAPTGGTTSPSAAPTS